MNVSPPSLPDQLARFVLVGGLATVLHYLILIALVNGAGADATIASTIGYALSTLVNYALNRRVTFRSQRRHGSALPRFLTLALVGLVINAAMVWLLAERLEIYYLIAQVAATTLTLLWNFIAARHWAFAPQTDQSR
jgi:putative flippase GtrA